MDNEKIIKVSSLLAPKDLVPIVIEITPEQFEKVKTGVLFDMSGFKTERSYLWLTERSWIILNLKEDVKK